MQSKVQQLGKNLGGIVDLGRHEGYTFTQEELEAYMDSISVDVGRELSDEELESVAAGGKWTDPGHCSTP